MKLCLQPEESGLFEFTLHTSDMYTFSGDSFLIGVLYVMQLGSNFLNKALGPTHQRTIFL